MKNFYKSAVIQLSQVFVTLWYVDFQRVFWNGVFRNLSNHAFGNVNFRKDRSYGDHVFSKIFKIECEFQK